MAWYRYKNNAHVADINGQLIMVDSNLEERVIRLLDSTGYAGRWRRTPKGLHVAGSNYTPDLELAVEENGKTHRALVEFKPAKNFFKLEAARRMVAVANYYFTDVLLLYAEQEDQWYRIDKTTLLMAPSIPPTPGLLPIDKLYDPWKARAKSVGVHTYTKRVEWEKFALRAFVNILETLLSAFKGSPKRRPVAKRHRPFKKHW